MLGDIHEHDRTDADEPVRATLLLLFLFDLIRFIRLSYLRVVGNIYFAHTRSARSEANF